MTETTWSEEAAPPPKKGIPVWVWGCGGGCLLALVAGLAGSVFLFGKVKQGLDPEVMWPKIAEVLPFDERPDYQVFGWTLGAEVYVMIDESDGLVGILFPLGKLEGDDAAEMDRFFEGELQGGKFGIGQMEDLEPLTLDVKGRPCRALRFTSSSSSIPGVPQGDDAQNVLLDLSRDPNNFVMLQLVDKDGTVEPAEIEAFLAPFDPWR